MCIAIVGLSILIANFSSMTPSTIFQNFEVSAYGTNIFVTNLYNRPYEIRIVVPDEFTGVFSILDYEGIKRLTEGTKKPVLEQTVEGSSLVNFTPNRRGAYMFLIESRVSDNVSGSIGQIEKAAMSQDLLVDSAIIVVFGFAMMLTAALLNLIKSSRIVSKRPQLEVVTEKPP